jgi:alpha-methylacyl-CoA racemase
LEPQFFATLLDVLGIDPASVPGQDDVERWPELRDRLTQVIGSQTRERWLSLAEGRDACVAPVLPMREAADHPQIRARATVVEVDGVPQPAPAPRFSATPAALDRPPARAGEHTDEVLVDCGFSDAEVAELRGDGVLG